MTGIWKRLLLASLCGIILAGMIDTSSLAGTQMDHVQAAEAFDYHAIFDAAYYAANNADVAAVYGNDAAALYNHFVTAGMLEGRQPSASFNVKIYMSNYADLQSVYGNNIAGYCQHYISSGMAEGRVANALLPGKKLIDFPQSTGAASQSGVDLTAWNLVLVNHTNGISTSYVPNVAYVADGEYLRSEVAPIVQQMIADAKAQGINLSLISGYRSASRQTVLYKRKVAYYRNLGYTQANAEAAAATVVNPPGYSEHQTGLCMDITDASYQSLTEGQETTAGYQWLLAHCAEYGFVLRYPQGKEAVTGVIYEPWHFRYVGTEAATEIMSQGITLEEYVANHS